MFDRKVLDNYHINDNNIFNKNSELINKCRHLKKFLLKHVKKKRWTLLSFMQICILYFSSKHKKYFFYLFLDRKDITCQMIACTWSSKLHEYLSFIVPFLNLCLCSLHWALWFSYRPSLYIIYSYKHTLHSFLLGEHFSGWTIQYGKIWNQLLK